MILAHPTADELAAFSNGRIEEGRAETIVAHLEECSPCRQLLKTVAPDELASLIRASSPRTLSNHGVAFNREAADSVPNSEIPPALLDHPRYGIVGKLGAGGMGVVYRAVDRRMDRVVALKLIHPDVADKSAVSIRFEREARAAAHLSHPNIVSVYDTDEASGIRFLVMEQVEGTNLAQFVNEHGPLAVEQAVECVRQAALGLQHAHERGMVHRDIKPSNLMRTPQGTIKVLDLGLAVFAPSVGGAPRFTELGEGLGTPDFIAPEQIRDAHSADIRGDIYSLGCTLYFLLAGQPPFPEGTTYEKIAHHLESTPRPLNAVRGGLPDRLAPIIERMLAKDPARRYQTPAEVIRDLDDFLLKSQGFRQFPRKHRGWMAVASLLLIGLVGLFFVRFHSSALPDAGSDTSGSPHERLETGDEIRRFVGHEGRVLAVAVSSDGRHALSGSEDGTVRTWNLRTGQEGNRLQLSREDSGIKGLVFSMDREYVAYFSEAGIVRLKSLTTGRELHRFDNGGPLRSIALSAHSRLVACLCHDNDVHLRDMASGREIQRLRGHTKEATSVAFTPNSRRVLSGGADGKLRLWQVDTGAQENVFQGHTGFVSSLAFSADGRFVLSGASRLFSKKDRSVRVWERTTGRQLQCFQGHGGLVAGVAFSPDASRVLSASEDKTVRLWDTVSGRNLRVFAGHTDGVATVAFTPDARYALSGSWDKTVRLWRLPTEDRSPSMGP